MRSLLDLIDLLFYLYSLLILARVLLSWFRFDPYHPVSTFLYGVTEPILRPIRRMMPQTGMVDFSPLVALILLEIVHMVIRQILLVSLYG